MEIILINVNKNLIRNIFLIFYLLEGNLFFVQKINKGKISDYNYLSLKNESFRKTSENSKIFGNINN